MQKALTAVLLLTMISSPVWASEPDTLTKKIRTIDFMHSVRDLQVATAATVSGANIGANPRQRKLIEDLRLCQVSRADGVEKDFALAGEKCPLDMNHKVLAFDRGVNESGDVTEHRETADQYSIGDMDFQNYMNLSSLQEKLVEDRGTLVSTPVELRTFEREFTVTRVTGEKVLVKIISREYTNMENGQITLKVSAGFDFSGSPSQPAFQTTGSLKQINTDENVELQEAFFDGKSLPYAEMEAILGVQH